MLRVVRQSGCARFCGRALTYCTGRFIFNNYRQALQIIAEGMRAQDVYERELKTSSDDYERYLVEERDYLRSLMSEPQEFTLKVEYMEALQKLEEARYAPPSCYVDDDS